MGGLSNLITVPLVLLAISSCMSAENDDEVGMSSQCGHTRYPTLCVQTLTGLSLVGNQENIDHVILSALVNRTISETMLPHSYFESIISTRSIAARMAIDDCRELIQMSLKRLNQAFELLKTSPKSHKADIQTWLSAALTFQETCKDAIQFDHDHVQTNYEYLEKIDKKMDYLSALGSNSLALVNRMITGSPTGEHERRQAFPDWLSVKNRKLLQSTEIKVNAVVAKDGSGNFKTVSEAIKAATGGRFVIYVKSGTYNEVINTNKVGITLIGDGKYSTIITAGSSVGEGSSLRGSATFTITGDGFMARDIGFQNTAGPESHQAVALRVSSDHSVLFRCSITGYQDTLYAHALRQFYRECDIYGTIDFIFGNAAAVFQSCTLILRRPRGGAGFNAILANGRTDPEQNTGFSVQNSKITVGDDFEPVKNSYESYLGRPWKAYSRAVVMQTNIDGEISGRGWAEWSGASGSTYNTLYFAEYANTGPGAGTSGRVGWGGFRVIGTLEATKFTVANFIGGNSWLPSTGVSFVSGL